MKKKIMITVSVILLLVLCAGGFMGWFFYQMRDMQPMETAKISNSIFVIKGKISNMYIVKTRDGFIAFDAGDDPEKIARGCKSLSIDPSSVQAVFLTHSDGDHVDGLPAFPMARVYLSSEEIPLLKDKAHRHFLGIGHMNKLPVSDYTTLADGNAVEIGGVTVNAIGTPGHTRGSMSFMVGDSLFVGDLCIIVADQVRPMIKIFTEDTEMDSASIRKIASLTNVKRIYTAHTGHTVNIEKALAMWR